MLVEASDSSTCPTPRDQTRAVRQSRAQPMERSEQRGRWCLGWDRRFTRSQDFEIFEIFEDE